eukprot:6088752-Amphidinium_carterae.1
MECGCNLAMAARPPPHLRPESRRSASCVLVLSGSKDARKLKEVCEKHSLDGLNCTASINGSLVRSLGGQPQWRTYWLRWVSVVHQCSDDVVELKRGDVAGR